jgi:hypothetical protein
LIGKLPILTAWGFSTAALGLDLVAIHGDFYFEAIATTCQLF